MRYSTFNKDKQLIIGDRIVIFDMGCRLVCYAGRYIPYYQDKAIYGFKVKNFIYYEGRPRLTLSDFKEVIKRYDT